MASDEDMPQAITCDTEAWRRRMNAESIVFGIGAILMAIILGYCWGRIDGALEAAKDRESDETEEDDAKRW